MVQTYSNVSLVLRVPNLYQMNKQECLKELKKITKDATEVGGNKEKNME